MSNWFRNVIIGLIASIGILVTAIVILEALGVDTGLYDLCRCDGCTCSGSGRPKKTRIKRNYTEITLPKE